MFVDFALILEHSFFLHQQQVQNPIETATEQYTSSGTSARDAKALKELYPQYKPQDEEKEKMVELVVDLISKHIICKSYMLGYLFIKIYSRFCSQECQELKELMLSVIIKGTQNVL